jgi:hypothetical protein
VSDNGPLEATDALGTIEAAPVETSNGDRHDRLATATARLRGSTVLMPDRWFQIAGWILVPLGLALILLGWYGTAHTTRVWEQTPFVVSGGFLGVGLLFIGGFAYYSYWLTRLVQDSQAQARDANELATRQAAALERIERLLARQQRGNALDISDDDVVLVATTTGTMAHRLDCAMVVGKDNLRTVDPTDPSLGACLVCHPPLKPATNGGATKARTRRRS